ncbi:MAG: hypothetical protein CL916_10290 [Deltaproteobacteria bacterium]|nr:hypothetical protein [Deltaproteobacteria bacterium]
MAIQEDHFMIMCIIRGSVVNCIVIGKGRAGSARVRTIQENRQCVLVRHVSGRDFHRPQEANRSLYFICTENKKHYGMAKTILESGHHVVVEFPPCTTQEEWDFLESLAIERGLILHCGLIGLYSRSHKHRKQWLERHSAQEICVDFSGGLYRWVQEEADVHHIPQLSFGRIVAIWDLVGPLIASEVQLEKNAHSYTFILHAKGKNGEKVVLREQREKERKRDTVWRMTGAKGETYQPQKRIKEDLFGIDLDRVLQNISSDVRISDILGFLDTVHVMTYGTEI